MYTDVSSSNYPKTLVIRNHEGGSIWQVYNVENKSEADRLATNASNNGFMAVTLDDHRPDLKETWPNWRDTEGGKKITKAD